MMEKSLTYAYPRKFAEGGEVDRDPYGRAYLSYEEASDPDKFKYTMYNYEGDVIQSGVNDRKYISNLFGANTVSTGGNIGLQMVAPITDKENIQILDDAGKERILEGNFDYGYLQPESIASGGAGPDAYIGDDEGPVFQVINPGSASGVAIAPSVPSGVEVPEGFKFAGMVDTEYQGPVASFTKLGDDTGFTIYAAENQFGKNKGKIGYYFDDVGDEVGSASTGGYLDANDAFNQGRTRSGNYVFHYNTLMDRGVELDDAAIEQLNAALAHHDKYLGGATGSESRRDNLINTMNAVQNYENYSGAANTIGDEEAIPIDFSVENFTPDATPTGIETIAPAPETPTFEPETPTFEPETPTFEPETPTFEPETPAPLQNPFEKIDSISLPETFAPSQNLSLDVTPPTFQNPLDNINPLDFNPFVSPTPTVESYGGASTLPSTTALPRTYGSIGSSMYQAPGQPRSYGSEDLQGTGNLNSYQSPYMTLPTAVDGSQTMTPLREGIGALFDRAKSLQGQSNYVNPFLRTGG